MHSKIASPVWHPFTQHALEGPLQRIVKTEGAHLIDESGHRILDAISSWWVITHGHRHPHIMKAIREATENFDQIIFADYTHQPAEALAQALLSLLPKTLQHVFYCDSGSVAVEVALKMALGFYKHTNKARTRIVVMEHSYHGDTIGAMSVGERSVFNQPYENFLFAVDSIPFPTPQHEQQTIARFEALCKKGDVAALLLEPLVLGAGGFKIYAENVLVELQRIAQKYDTLIIADEVMTGWGRTGQIFACEKAGITPDILCTSKGLTGGSLPLAATICHEKIFQAHLSLDRRKTFYHSSSYTANPIACAAALANIEIWQNEPVLERIQLLETMQHEYIQRFRHDERFKDVRQIGTITALNVNVESPGYLSDTGPKLRAYFKEKNILLRPLGEVIYVMPPYCVTKKDLAHIYQTIAEAVAFVLCEA